MSPCFLAMALFAGTSVVARGPASLDAGELDFPACEQIRYILQSTTSDQEKARRLSSFVRLGDQQADVDKLLGASLPVHANRLGRHYYYLEPELYVVYSLNDKVVAMVGYSNPAKPKIVWLAVEARAK